MERRRQSLPLFAILNPPFAFFIKQKASGLEENLFPKEHEQQLTSFFLPRPDIYRYKSVIKLACMGITQEGREDADPQTRNS